MNRDPGFVVNGPPLPEYVSIPLQQYFDANGYSGWKVIGAILYSTGVWEMHLSRHGDRLVVACRMFIETGAGLDEPTRVVVREIDEEQ